MSISQGQVLTQIMTLLQMSPALLYLLILCAMSGVVPSSGSMNSEDNLQSSRASRNITTS